MASRLTEAHQNPYLITGPALISFSGGRTSAFMLHEILKAHGGMLPDDVVVAFANTGKEREETLRFVHECSVRWNVRVRWVEWRPDNRESKYAAFEEVGYNSASRNGEPFEALIDLKRRLPNWRERWCTTHLKVLAKFALMRAELGLEPGQYLEVIGLRDDEGMRVFKGLERAEKDGSRIRYPLAKGKIKKADVMEFWRNQPFDLQLQPWQGNCSLCFLKGKGLRKQIIRDQPSIAEWWARQEIKHDGFFDRRNRVRELVEEIKRSPQMDDKFTDEEYDVECGLTCAA